MKDILKHKRPPERLLERSDVTLCKGIPEPESIEALPDKIRFLMIIGVPLFISVAELHFVRRKLLYKYLDTFQMQLAAPTSVTAASGYTVANIPIEGSVVSLC